MLDGKKDKRIHEEVLRDIRYPLHRIAGKLLPCLRVLADQFQPEKVVPSFHGEIMRKGIQVI